MLTVTVISENRRQHMQPPRLLLCENCAFSPPLALPEPNLLRDNSLVAPSGEAARTSTRTQNYNAI